MTVVDTVDVLLTDDVDVLLTDDDELLAPALKYEL